MNYNLTNKGLTLFTDFYELTMMQGYFFNSPDDKGVFEMIYRYQPFNGGYAIFAGLSPLLNVLENIKFSKDDIFYLKNLNQFHDDFLDFLYNFSFKGDIYSLKEGSVAFPNEPLFRVHGSLMEIQLIESVVLNFLNFQSLIATKTARIVDSAKDKPVLEFGLRRAHGVNGALSATRASYIGGVNSTSNTLAGKLYGIPVAGTMAHSWIMTFDNELESFEKYAQLYPDRCVLLVDTFDTLKSGVPNAIKIFSSLKSENPKLMAIRLDSGDLEYLSKRARSMLDENELQDVKIFVSSDMDEWIVKQLINSSAPIDAWGVGTRLVTGWDDSAFPGVYKIIAKKKGNKYIPKMKISNQPEKITNPGIKNIMRFFSENNQMLADLIYLEDDDVDILKKIENKEPIHFNHPTINYSSFVLGKYKYATRMLKKVMDKGKKLSQPSLEDSRKYREMEINSLDKTFRRLLNPHIYKVSLSDNLLKLKTDMIKSITNNANN